MKKLPPKLFELSQNGVSEEDIQHIFDALVHAEEERIQFVNVYFHDAEPSSVRRVQPSRLTSTAMKGLDRRKLSVLRHLFDCDADSSPPCKLASGQ